MDIGIPVAVLVVCSLVLFVALMWLLGTVYFAAREAWEYFERENRRAKQQVDDPD